MRIHCPYCQSKSYITHHTRPTPKMDELYCICMNLDCSARFVYRAYYSHTLAEPVSDQTNALHEQLANMDPEQRKELLKPYLHQPSLF